LMVNTSALSDGDDGIVPKSFSMQYNNTKFVARLLAGRVSDKVRPRHRMRRSQPEPGLILIR
jgi:hypothetical protein